MITSKVGIRYSFILFYELLGYARPGVCLSQAYLDSANFLWVGEWWLWSEGVDVPWSFLGYLEVH